MYCIHSIYHFDGFRVVCVALQFALFYSEIHKIFYDLLPRHSASRCSLWARSLSGESLSVIIIFILLLASPPVLCSELVAPPCERLKWISKPGIRSHLHHRQLTQMGNTSCYRHLPRTGLGRTECCVDSRSTVWRGGVEFGASPFTLIVAEIRNVSSTVKQLSTDTRILEFAFCKIPKLVKLYSFSAAEL